MQIWVISYEFRKHITPFVLRQLRAQDERVCSRS